MNVWCAVCGVCDVSVSVCVCVFAHLNVLYVICIILLYYGYLQTYLKECCNAFVDVNASLMLKTFRTTISVLRCDVARVYAVCAVYAYLSVYYFTLNFSLFCRIPLGHLQFCEILCMLHGSFLFTHSLHKPHAPQNTQRNW